MGVHATGEASHLSALDRLANQVPGNVNNGMEVPRPRGGVVWSVADLAANVQPF